MLKQKNGAVRSIDIVRQMAFSKPSVSHAMGLLRQRGQITMDKDGWIELTDEGRALAERVYERHCLLSEWLVKLGVSPEVAAEDACRIEHVISQESFDCIRRHVEERLQEG